MTTITPGRTSDLQQRLGIPGTALVVLVLYFVIKYTASMIPMWIYSGEMSDVSGALGEIVERAIQYLSINQLFVLLGFLLLQRAMRKDHIYFRSWGRLLAFCLVWLVMSIVLITLEQAMVSSLIMDIVSYMNMVWEAGVSTNYHEWLYAVNLVTYTILGLLALWLSVVIFSQAWNARNTERSYQRNRWTSAALMALCFSFTVLFIIYIFMEMPYISDEMPMHWLVASILVELSFWILLFGIPGAVAGVVFWKTNWIPTDGVAILGGLLAGVGVPFLTYWLMQILLEPLDIDNNLVTGLLLVAVFIALFLGFCLLFVRLAGKSVNDKPLASP